MSETTWVLLAVCAGGVLYHIWRERCWDRERSDLLSRVQAGSLAEYTQSVIETHNALETPEPEEPEHAEERIDPATLVSMEHAVDRGVARYLGQH